MPHATTKGTASSIGSVAKKEPHLQEAVSTLSRSAGTRVSTRKRRRQLMLEGHPSTGQRASLQDESAAEIPWLKKYVRAIIAEAYPQGVLRTHDGDMTWDIGKEMGVINLHPLGTDMSLLPWP